MTDYTPKTEYVKNSYVWFRDEVTADAARAEFDRWLAQVKADAVAEFIVENVKEFRNSTSDDRKLGQCCAHCKDPHCYGCECDSGCDDFDGGVSRDYYAGMVEGRIQERERILKILFDEGFYDSLAFLVSGFLNKGTE